MEKVCSYFKRERGRREKEWREEVRLLYFSFWRLSTYHEKSFSTWRTGSCLINVRAQGHLLQCGALSPSAPRWVSTFRGGCWEVPFSVSHSLPRAGLCFWERRKKWSMKFHLPWKKQKRLWRNYRPGSWQGDSEKEPLASPAAACKKQGRPIGIVVTRPQRTLWSNLTICEEAKALKEKKSS